MGLGEELLGHEPLRHPIDSYGEGFEEDEEEQESDSDYGCYEDAFPSCGQDGRIGREIEQQDIAPRKRQPWIYVPLLQVSTKLGRTVEPWPQPPTWLRIPKA